MVTSDSPARLHELEHHIHSVQQVAPSGAMPVTVTSDGAAWTLGAFSNDIIAAAAVTFRYDVHWVVISTPSANASYEIVLYYGAGDTECARIKFTRDGAFVQSVTVPVITPLIPEGSRLRAKGMDSVGGKNVLVSVFFHEYD